MDRLLLPDRMSVRQMHPFTLRFASKRREATFLADHKRRSLGLVRAALVLGSGAVPRLRDARCLGGAGGVRGSPPDPHPHERSDRARHRGHVLALALEAAPHRRLRSRRRRARRRRDGVGGAARGARRPRHASEHRRAAHPRRLLLQRDDAHPDLRPRPAAAALRDGDGHRVRARRDVPRRGVAPHHAAPARQRLALPRHDAVQRHGGELRAGVVRPPRVHLRAGVGREEPRPRGRPA